MCTLNHPLNIFMESIMTDALEDHEGTVSIGGRTITNLRSANAIDGLEEVEDCLLYTSPSPRDRGISRMPSSA